MHPPNRSVFSALYAISLLTVFLGDPGYGAGPAFLVKDINTQPDAEIHSDPADFLTVNGVTFFTADDGLRGRELWSTDGTPAGTRIVVDLYPGERGSEPAYLTELGGALYFAAGSGFEKCGLWRSDGSAEGTMAVRNFPVDTFGCVTFQGGRRGPIALTKVGNELFFAATDDAGTELWKTDGSERGTTRVKDINRSGGSYPWPLAAIGPVLFFAADDGVHGRELWRTDGTEAGTILIRDINLGGSGGLDGSDTPWALALDGVLIFPANDGASGTELWRSDGTEEGTALVEDLNPGSFGSLGIAYSDSIVPRPLAARLGDAVFFFTASFTDNRSSYALWRSNGTALGTVQLTSFPPESNKIPGQLTVVGDRLLFATAYSPELWVSDGTVDGTTSTFAFDPAQVGGPLSLFEFQGGLIFLTATPSELEVWRSDGTAVGTRRVRGFPRGDPAQFPTWPSYARTAASSMGFFVAADATRGRELFRTDGSENGTALLQDINLGTERTQAAFDVEDLPWIGTVGEAAVFVATDGLDRDRVGLWRSDGTAAGTFPIAEYREHRVFSGSALGSTLFFFADDGLHGLELWRTDATHEGTAVVKEVVPGPAGIGFSRLVGFGHRLAFVAGMGSETQLWVTDGSEAGTAVVKSFGFLADAPRLLAAGPDERLYFVVFTHEAGAELWVTDGTQTGTRKLKDINPDPRGIGPHAPVVWNEQLFFLTDDDEHGVEIWRTDGTEAGTVLLKDLVADSNGALFAPLHVVGDRLLAFGRDAAGFALFESDGTADGSRFLTRVPEIFTSASPSTGFFFEDVVFLERTALFLAYDETAGLEPWRTDGTSDGTRRLADIFPGPSLSTERFNEYSTARVGGQLLFVANDGLGDELWSTYGNESGTMLLRDIDTRSADEIDESGGRLAPTSVAGTVLFQPFDVRFGYELWKSDGRPSGTQIVQDIAAGPLSSYAGETGYRLIGSSILFMADDKQHGLELWALPVDALGLPCSGDCDRNGSVSIDELVRAVNIALDRSPLLQCTAVDQDFNAQASIDELVRAVRHALDGC